MNRRWIRVMSLCLALIFLAGSALAEFKIPEALVTLEEEAFLGVSMAGLVTAPASLKTIGDRAFAGASLYALNLSGASPTHIGSRLFDGTEVAYVRVGTSVPSDIADDAFDGARMIIGGQNWKKYADARGIAFYKSSEVKTSKGFYYWVSSGEATLLCAVDAESVSKVVTLPGTVSGATVKHIGGAAFFGCAQVTDITLPDAVTDIADGAFSGAPNASVHFESRFGITRQPSGVYASEGEWVTLSLQASADTYRWQYFDGDWSDLVCEGQGTNAIRVQLTSALIREASSWGSSANLWRCVVGSEDGESEISRAVYVLERPCFAVQPSDQPGNAGDRVTFTAEVAGAYTSWRWERRSASGGAWSALSNETASSGSCEVIATAENLDSVFRAVALDANGGAWPSQEVRIRRLGDLFIEEQPADVVCDVGESATLRLKARNATAYRWQASSDGGASWSNLSGANAATDALTVTVAEEDYEKAFRCVISNGSDSITSSTVYIQQSTTTVTSIVDATPFCWSSRSAVALEDGIPVGGSVILNGYASEAGWTWETEDLLIVDDDGKTVITAEGTTAEVMEIVQAAETSDGSAHIRLELQGNRVGRAMLRGSNGAQQFSAIVEVYGDEPVIVTQPQHQAGDVGDTVQFSVDAIGVSAYEWQKNTKPYGDDYSHALYSVEIGSGENQASTRFLCKLTGKGGGTVNTQRAYIYPPCTCWIDEEDFSVAEGDDYEFHCHAYGCLEYKLEYSYNGETWYVDGGDSKTTPWVKIDYNRKHTMTNAYNTYYNRMWRFTCIGLDGVEVHSDIVRVLEPQPVAITVQPVDQVARVGETVQFSVEAENAASYWWQVSYDSGASWAYVSVNGVNQTTPTISVKATEYLYDNVIWRCAVTGVCGYQMTSRAVSLKRPNLGFVKQPADQIVALGETAVFSVEASQAAGYQWQQRIGSGSWTNISSATGATLRATATTSTLSNVQYRCVVTGVDGDKITSAAVRMIEKLAIDAQPQSVALAVGSKATFTASASGAKAWQWVFSADGGMTWTPSTESDAKTSTLSFTVAAEHYNGLWRCDITGDNQSISTQSVSISPLLRITTQPVNVEASIGQTAVFEITAENAATYRWQVSADGGATWSNASGTSTSRRYSYAVSDQSDYELRWRCVVKDSKGVELISDIVRAVEPQILPTIYAEPISVYAADGEKAVFTVSATGATKYQWQMSTNGGTTWSAAKGTGAQSNALTVSVTETLWNTALWRCALTGSGNALCYTESVRVYEPMKIITQPVEAEGRVGELATISLRASGFASTQWQVSADMGMTWANCAAVYASELALDVPATEACFESYRWRCVLTGPLGDRITSDAVGMRRATVLATGLSLDMAEIVLVPGQTTTLHATIEPADVTEPAILWVSDTPSVATVDDQGVVTAAAAGTARVRANLQGFDAVCTVTVAKAFNLEFPDFVTQTWTNATDYTGIRVKFNGAVLPVTVNATMYNQKGTKMYTSGDVQVTEEEWTWSVNPFTSVNTYYAVVKAMDAKGRSVEARTGTITVSRRPLYRALMIYQEDWNIEVDNSYSPWFKYDAEYMGSILEQNSYEGGAQYTVAYSRNQTKANIGKKIKSTFAGVVDGDVSYIQIGCHGDPSEKTGSSKKDEGCMFVPAASSAAQFKERGNNSSNSYWLTASELASWIKKYIPKGKVVVVLTSCGSGSMIFSESDASKGATDANAAFLSALKSELEGSGNASRTGELRNSRYSVLTASAYHESGYGYRSTGAWLIDWLTESGGFYRNLGSTAVYRLPWMCGDADGDGSVTIGEAYRYIESCSAGIDFDNPQAYMPDPGFVMFHYDD